ncbi:MAG: UbiD family decarboxylase [Candidatus Methanomethylophilaceae archaeon]|nr:UbiD family decarboxylase [Candidatus Methanomethylophilaceae archaeon]
MSVRKYLSDSSTSIEKIIDPDTQDATAIMDGDQNTTFIFENLNGGKAVGNLFSTRQKIADAMNITQGEIVSHMIHAIDNPADTQVVDDPEFRFQEIPVDLMKLPLCKYFPEDGGRYISSGVIVSEYGGKRNVSFHRMMIMDKDSIAVRLVPRHLYTMYNNAKKDGKELNISICIGARPEVLLAAATSTAYDADEMRIASAMVKKSFGELLKMGKCDNGLLVPSDTDYVLEGRITFDTTKEGPFVDITGTYDFIRDQPVIKIDKIWACKDPVMQLLLPGGNEHYLFMGLPREPMMFKTVQQAVPRTHNVRLTEGGCCWLNGVVSITKNKEGDGINAIMAAFTGHPSMKHVIIVDEDIDIFDDRQVEWAVATRWQADRMLKIEGAAGSSLDPSAEGTTWKLGIDATIPLKADKAAFRKATY